MGEKVLSYGDALLRQEDLDILSGPFWLTDRIIDFYFEFVSNELLAPLPPPSKEERVLLLGPSVSFCVAWCQTAADVAQVVGPLQLPSRELVLFAVNDNSSPQTAEGGSHWSLLVFLRSASCFLHFDSSHGANLIPARELASKVSSSLGLGPSGFSFISARAPQQRNGYDCGVFLLGFVHKICSQLKDKRLMETTSRDLEHYASGFSKPDNAKAFRNYLRELIRDLSSKNGSF